MLAMMTILPETAHLLCGDSGCQKCASDVDVQYSTKYVGRVFAGITFSRDGCAAYGASDGVSQLGTKLVYRIHNALFDLDVGLRIFRSRSMLFAGRHE